MQGTVVSAPPAVEYFVRPKSIAIIGFSSKPSSPGRNILANIAQNGYPAEVYLVGRSGGDADGRPVLTDVDMLPMGVDLAIFTLPGDGVAEAMAACARRKVRAAIVFAAGFAEMGERGKQDEVARIAAEGGIALLGPNCLGYTNFIDGLHVGFVAAVKIQKMAVGRDPAFAIISHSGGLMSHIRQGLEQRDVCVGYTVNTGNEAGAGIADFVDFFAQDDRINGIIVYVEEVRDPQSFLAAAARARKAGKPVLMMHPGRSAKAQEATMSHTGALAGDHAAMRATVSRAGILFIDNVDELIDTAEILARFPKAPTQGGGVITFSGAFCAIAHDFCEEIGLDLPPLSKETESALRAALPVFATPRNPLDLTTAPVWQPDLMRVGTKALLDDPAIGSVTISITMATPQQGVSYLNAILQALPGNEKPFVLSLLGDRTPLPPEFGQMARDNRIIVSRSADRSLRAMTRVTEYGRMLDGLAAKAPPQTFAGLPAFGQGAQPEWLGKQALRALGVATPEGDLARSADDAVAIAARVGFPVAMKAQAAALAHKTEAGGVMLNIASAEAARAAFETLCANVARAQAGVTLDGVLVEKMSKRGLELLVGARRDPRWGPVVLIGLGGTLIEAIGDVRILPPDLTEEAIVAEFRKLKTARLLDGFRGAPAVDVEAAARVASRIGALMLSESSIVEIDINPLMAHARGEGVTALDALIVTRKG
ncbi:MAG: acetate--CoA ligase family protein [Beijerinckiaceae bacterium]|nr:acetate--CoA ligase family protein [Beijerinckiaceae bacterium]